MPDKGLQPGDMEGTFNRKNKNKKEWINAMQRDVMSGHGKTRGRDRGNAESSSKLPRSKVHAFSPMMLKRKVANKTRRWEHDGDI